MSVQLDSRASTSSIDSDPKATMAASEDLSSVTVVETSSSTPWQRVKDSLALQTVIACLLGFAIGLAVQTAEPHEDVTEIIGYPGELFIRVLKLIVLPLIAVSMAMTPSKLGDMTKMSAIGKRVLAYYLCTTFLAAAEGLIWVNIFRPGSSQSGFEGGCGLTVDTDEYEETSGDNDVLSSILGIGRGALDANLMDAFVSTNILGVITFFTWFGLVLARFKDTPNGKITLGMLDTANDVFMVMIHQVIRITPIGVFSLILGEVSQLSDTMCMMRAIGLFMGTAITAFLFHILVVYPTLFWATTRKNAFTDVYKGIAQAYTTALSTSSSAATLPVTLRNNIENNKVDPGTANFVLPLGATVNMDGTAIGFPIAAIFLANMTGFHLTAGNQIVIAIVASFVSIGAAPIPSAGLVYLIVILESVGIQPTGVVSFILAVDWLIDRFETSVNICGDSIGVCIIDYHVNGKQKKLDSQDDSETDELESGEQTLSDVGRASVESPERSVSLTR